MVGELLTVDEQKTRMVDSDEHSDGKTNCITRKLLPIQQSRQSDNTAATRNHRDHGSHTTRTKLTSRAKKKKHYERADEHRDEANQRGRAWSAVDYIAVVGGSGGVIFEGGGVRGPKTKTVPNFSKSRKT